MTVPLVAFGPGILFVTRTDGVGPYTAVNIGYVQEFDYTEKGMQKQLFGQGEYPLDSARGTITATGKMKAATISALALNSCFHGGTFSPGQLLMALAEPHTIPATPFTITIVPPASGVFNKENGVVFALTNLPLTRVTGTPSVSGTYSVNETTGVYIFDSADTLLGVNITYAYTVATGGQTQIILNTLIGSNPTFQIDYYTTRNARPYYVRFFQCVADSLTRAHKLTDFVMPEIDYGFYANDAGQVYTASYPMIA